MQSTWFHYLPEIGRSLSRKADNITYDDIKIKRLEKELRELKKARKQAEATIMEEVNRDYTETEITQAKEIFKAGGYDEYIKTLE